MTSIITLIATIISGVLTTYILDSIVRKKLKKKIPNDSKHPITINILKIILFLSGGLLLSEINTSFQTLIKILPSSVTGNDLLFKEFGYFSIFLVITIILLIVLIWLSFLMFTLLSKGENIFVEVANNNMNAVILFAGIILSLTFVVKTALIPVFDLLIPYPTMPIYH